MYELVIPGLSLAIATTSLAISYVTSTKTRTLQVRPVLIFSRRSGEVWQVQNVGNGPALNPCLGEMDWDSTWRRFTRCYPLAPDISMELRWISYTCALAITYEDVLGNVYTSQCRYDRSDVSQGNKFPTWPLGDAKDEFERRRESEAAAASAASAVKP
ncbi:MAG TPA: hypothetical protein VF337_03670 [Candidatus Limnocylindrales bacterium]